MLKTNTNFIVYNASEPTYNQTKIVKDKNKWIDQTISLNPKFANSQKAQLKYDRLYFQDEQTKT